MVDIGCGSGSFSKFCKVMFPDISYTGMDYSPNAIGLSKSAWPSTDFFLKDFWSLTSKDMQKYDLIYEDALLDVLSNGDEALNHIMSLKTKAVFLNRVKNGPEPSHYTTYDAYGYLPTYSFYHNREKLIASIESNYKICTEISSPPYSSFCMIEPINPRESLCKN
jgi:trans-aconitate methyltransferase